MPSDLYKRALRRAGEILGGPDALAAYLGVDSERIAKWTAGGARPPARVMKSVAAVIRHQMLKNCPRPAAKRRRA
jgi:hypothetical protein